MANYILRIENLDGSTATEAFLSEEQFQDIGEIAAVKPEYYTRHALAFDTLDTITDKLRTTHKTLDEIVKDMKEGLK